MLTAYTTGVPEAVLMTKVDKACVMTRDCLRNIYKSKKIREKVRSSLQIFLNNCTK